MKPADALAAGHIDATATAEITWGGLAVTGGATPAWNRTTATCSNTYCHGRFNNGNATAAPVWTGTNQGACGTCHGLPPGGTHPAVGTALTGCSACHNQTMTAAGALIAPSAGGKHLDGLIQATGGTGGHVTGWMDTASANFHAYSAIAGIASCQGCHGANLDGVGGSATTSCATCHGATWKTNCTFCHGGTANTTGAPPKGTWGFRTDAARIGAHTKHVTAGAISSAITCATCHVTPANALSTGHLNGSTATVTWGGIAASSGAAPAWNRDHPHLRQHLLPRRVQRRLQLRLLGSGFRALRRLEGHPEVDGRRDDLHLVPRQPAGRPATGTAAPTAAATAATSATRT